MKSASPPCNGNSGYSHDLSFHQESDSLYWRVAEFLLDGLAADESALVISTACHRDVMLKYLLALSFDVACLRMGGGLFLLDARETLSELTTDRRLDAPHIVDAAVKAVEKACRAGTRHFAVRIYGELTGHGNDRSAAPITLMWCRLAATPDVIFLSDYAIAHGREGTAEYDVWPQRGCVISTLEGFAHPAVTRP